MRFQDFVKLSSLWCAPAAVWRPHKNTTLLFSQVCALWCLPVARRLPFYIHAPAESLFPHTVRGNFNMNHVLRNTQMRQKSKPEVCVMLAVWACWEGLRCGTIVCIILGASWLHTVTARYRPDAESELNTCEECKTKTKSLIPVAHT